MLALAQLASACLTVAPIALTIEKLAYVNQNKLQLGLVSFAPDHRLRLHQRICWHHVGTTKPKWQTPWLFDPSKPNPLNSRGLVLPCPAPRRALTPGPRSKGQDLGPWRGLVRHRAANARPLGRYGGEGPGLWG